MGEKMNWYKKSQYKQNDFEDMFGDDFFGKKNINRNILKEEKKTDNKTINLYRNFDADLNKIKKDKNGNLILSPNKGEQGVIWFAHDLQNNPSQYYDRGAKYLLIYPLDIQYNYIEKTYDNGDIIKEPIYDYDNNFENSSEWAGYVLPEGFKFSYKTQKHIICEKELIIPPKYITETYNELV